MASCHAIEAKLQTCFAGVSDSRVVQAKLKHAVLWTVDANKEEEVKETDMPPQLLGG